MTRPNDAADWAVRRTIGQWSDTDQVDLEIWLAGDQGREGALLQAEIALAFMERAQVILPAQPTAPSVISRRHAILYWGAGAAVAASTAGFWLANGDHVSTGVGEVRRTQLADTSSITLNTQSRVTVDLTPKERRVSLDSGEAWFQVAHDKVRPFVVSADHLKIRAIGTAFSVRRMASGVDVLVTEGTVEVWRADQPRQRARVSRDHRVFMPDDGVALAPVSAKAGIERALAWRGGRLSLAGEALDYAVAELNRYNHVQLRIDDPVLGRVPIYGYFRVNDPEGFAQMVAGSEGARVERHGDMLRIIPQIS